MRFTIIKTLFGLIILTAISAATYGQCGCKFIISNPNDYQFDGAAKGVQPGDKICLANGTRTGLSLKNINGTAANPVIITNMCDGEVFLNAPANWGSCVTFQTSKHYRVTGSANPNVFYGIKISGATHGFINENFCSDLEIDHVWVTNTGCQGISAKTDASCDPATQFGGFTMRNTSFHDIKIENTGCEAFYIGESHYDIGLTGNCGAGPVQIYEHAVDNVKVYNCILNNIGNDGIQIGSATNAVIYNNTINGTGLNGTSSHSNGIQCGDGTTQALAYNNYINQAGGYGIFDSGGGGTYYNNIIINSGSDGFFLRDAPVSGAPAAPGFAPTGFTIVNNTIINSANYAVYNLSENPNMSYFYNNIVVNQKTPYIYLNNGNVKWTASNNIQTLDINSPKFVNAPAKDFHLTTNSTTALNLGKDVGYLGISSDYDGQPRPNGTGYDIGAFEFQTGGPTSNAGADKNITLPTNSVILNGAGTSSTGITGYLWTKKSGGAATLTNETTSNLTVSGLVAGTYVFEFRVIDASGFAFDEVTVTVLPVATNQNPTANAGSNKTITLPTNTLILNGIGTDPDGSISNYQWTKVSGPTATLTNATTPNLSLSNLLQGSYVFQLTVTDNNSATASSQVTVTVNPAATNQLPIVNAGSQKTIFLPVNQVIITATASDPDGSISTILWEKKSGGTATLSNSNTLTLTASGLVAGNYTFRITVTDNKGATAFSEVVVIVIQANQSPTANAGSDQSLTLPTNNIILSGSGIDPDGSIVGYAWIKVSGPTASLTNTNTATLNVSNMLQGTYVFRLTVTDNSGSTGADEVSVFVSVPGAGANVTPLSIAGGNVSFSLPTNSVNLFGSGFDTDGSIVSYAWTKASGGSATLTNANTPTLTITNLQAGQYTFRLIVTDNDGETDDDLAIVTISALGTNVFPVASAGADRIIRLPLTSVSLAGSGTDEDGQITGYAWAQVAGVTAVISSPNAAATLISGLAEGDYTFRLTVTDNLGATDLNEVNVKVVTSISNIPPVVDAGPDLNVFLPQNTLTINATASDDGTITSFQWSKLGGPPVTLENPTQQNLSLSGLVLGEYQFQLSVTDNNSATVFDVVRISVLPSNFAPPVVDAGINQEITLPVNQVSIAGTASSPNGTIANTAWTKSIGPAATLTGANTLTLDATNLVAGSYVFKLTATDNTGKSTSDNVEVLVNPVPPNQPPVVSAGPNTSVILPITQVVLIGTVTDSDGTVASLQWSQLNGPSTATLQNSTTLSLTATNLIKGAYTFKLEAHDNSGNIGFNYAIVFVSDPASTENLPPIVFAGEDVVQVLPNNEVSIIGTALDPEGTSISKLFWEQVQGEPATFAIESRSILNVSNLTVGSYTFKLSATDDDLLTASDEVLITVIEGSQEIPKFFSPNGDGVGETWVIRNIDSYQTCSLVVFSRSGQSVFKAQPYQNNWDGTFNGKPLSDGDYYYVMSCDDGRKLKGALRLIR